MSHTRLKTPGSGPIGRFVWDSARQGLHLLPSLIVIALAATTMATLLARFWWAFDLATHFRVHYVAVAVLGVSLAMVQRRRVMTAAIAILAVPHAMSMTSLTPLSPSQAVAAEASTAIRLTTVNAYWRNWDSTALVDHVERTDPDILVIQETARSWRPDLLRIGERFPHALPDDWRESRGVVVFSRFPMTEATRRYANGRDFDYQAAEMEIAGQTVTLVGLHTASPINDAAWDSRNRHFGELARYAADTETPLLVAGDFNSTNWSPHFADMADSSGLRNASGGNGWRPTWPSWLPVGGIPIDHILISDTFAVQGIQRGPNIGSDHYPITADLLLR